MPTPRPGRRVAERPPTLWTRAAARLRAARPGRRGLLVVGLLMLATGLVLLGCALVEVGPHWLERVGALLVATVYVAALAGRVGGRPLWVGAAAFAVGVAVLAVDHEILRSGAAVLLTVVAAVLGVMITVPAVRSLHALREVLVAVLVAAGGSFAAVGFGPMIDQARFEYLTLALGLVAALYFVYRLGAGLHGLGKRGLLIVLVGGLVLAVTLAYAELLRRYGSPGMVDGVLSTVTWTRETFGAVPRPLAVLLGVPALMWGCHMRARRRQGWWVCAFGIAATVPVAHSLMNLDASVFEAALGQLYSTALGVLVGYAVIRLDLAVTGPRGSRARRAEEASAVRPEPPRTRALQ